MQVFKRVLVVSGAPVAGSLPGAAAIQGAGLPAWYLLVSTLLAAVGVAVIPGALGMAALVAGRARAGSGVRLSAAIAGGAALAMSLMMIRQL